MPAEGIEPPTFGLQNRCSTAELSRLQDQWVSTKLSPFSGRRRQADPVLRRHLPELPAQGYWPAKPSRFPTAVLRPPHTLTAARRAAAH